MQIMKRKLLLAGVAIVAGVAPLLVGMATPKFEVASIRPNKDCAVGGARGGDGKSAGAPPRQASSPGRLNECNTVMTLITMAYIVYANGQFHPGIAEPGFVEIGGRTFIRAEGGPAWVNSDRYQITATADGNQPVEMVRGPMLQALLEDRFRLKIHTETREIPVYALTVAKGGPRLNPSKEGSCTPVDRTKLPSLPPAPGQKYCGWIGRWRGSNLTVDAPGTSLGEFSKMLENVFHHPVIDKTGIAGLFDFHLEFVVDAALGMTSPPPLPLNGDPAAAPPEPGPSIFTALQELGLKIDESAKGPGQFLVIDSVERPSEN
jgi:uncharacterized protein (TIGR03435 family)